MLEQSLTHISAHPNTRGRNQPEQSTDGLSAREQRHNRPETIKHREETRPLVRDIYIIEKDFQGNGGSCMAKKTHTHTHRLSASLLDMPNNDPSSLSVSLSGPGSQFLSSSLPHLPLSLLNVPADIIQIAI